VGGVGEGRGVGGFAGGGEGGGGEVPTSGLLPRTRLSGEWLRSAPNHSTGTTDAVHSLTDPIEGWLSSNRVRSTRSPGGAFVGLAPSCRTPRTSLPDGPATGLRLPAPGPR